MTERKKKVIILAMLLLLLQLISCFLYERSFPGLRTQTTIVDESKAGVYGAAR